MLSALPTMMHDLVPIHEMATANGINTLTRTVGGVVGTQLTAALLATTTAKGTTIPSQPAFATAFWLAAAVSAATAIAAATFTSPQITAAPSR